MAVRAESRPDRVDDRELSQRLALAIDAKLTLCDLRVATCGLHRGLARRSRPRQTTGDASPLAVVGEVWHRNDLDADVAALPSGVLRPPESEFHGLSGRQSVRARHVCHPDPQTRVAGIKIGPGPVAVQRIVDPD